MKKIIFEIDNRKYLLFDAEINMASGKSFMEAIQENNGIIQSNKINQGGWITKPTMAVSVLIPEENAVKFSNHKIKQ